MSSPSDAPSSVSRPPRKLSRRRLWFFRLVTLLVLAAGQEALFRLVFPEPEVAGFNRIHYQQMAQSHPQIGKAMQRYQRRTDEEIAARKRAYNEDSNALTDKYEAEQAAAIKNGESIKAIDEKYQQDLFELRKKLAAKKRAEANS